MNAKQIALMAIEAPMSAAIETIKHSINASDVVCEMYYVASPDMSEDKFTAILQGYESLVDCQAARDLAKAA